MHDDAHCCYQFRCSVSLHGARQQTRRPHDGTDRRTDTRSLRRPCSAYTARICCCAPLPLSIDISCPHGAQQQTRRTLLLRSNDGTGRRTDGRTDTRSLPRSCSACYPGSASHRELSVSRYKEKKVKVSHTRLPSVGFRRLSRFFAVSLQVT